MTLDPRTAPRDLLSSCAAARPDLNAPGTVAEWAQSVYSPAIAMRPAITVFAMVCRTEAGTPVGSAEYEPRDHVSVSQRVTMLAIGSGTDLARGAAAA